MLQLGFSQSKSDYSLFTKGKDQSFVVLLVYVDDIVIASPSIAVITIVKQQLQSYFKLNDLGVLHYFLGLEIACSKASIFLSQQKYTLSLLEDTGFLSFKPAKQTMDCNIMLNFADSDPLPDSSQYHRLVGWLLYLILSWPDICFAVNRLSQFVSQPRTPYLDASLFEGDPWPRAFILLQVCTQPHNLRRC